MQKITLIAMLALSFTALLLSGCASAPIKEGMTSDGHAYRGSATPKIIIYEHSDFECPFCSRVQPAVEEVLRAYPETVQLQFRHNPLPMHSRAIPAAIASVCAERQGKFWELHDRMFAAQNALEDADLKKYAQEAGLDMEQFSTCIVSKEASGKVNAELAEGAQLGVEATPTFIIGQSQVRGAQPFSVFKSVIDSEIARAG